MLQTCQQQERQEQLRQREALLAQAADLAVRRARNIWPALC